MERTAPHRIVIAATEEELNRIARFRYDVYVRECGRLTELADHERCELHDPDDDSATHFSMVDQSGAVVAVLRVHAGAIPERIAAPLRLDQHFRGLRTSQIYVASKLMVASRLRSGMCGVRMLARLIQHGLDQGHSALFATTFPHLLPLYSRCGLQPYRPYHDALLGPHHALMMFINQQPPVVQRLMARSQRERWEGGR